MDWTKIMAGGAIGGVLLGTLTAGWAKVKNALWWCVSFMIYRVSIEDDHTARLVLSYMITNLKRSSVYDRTYGSSYESIKVDGRYGAIPYENFGGKSIVFWGDRRPILFSPASSQDAKSKNGASLVCLRGTIDPEKIIVAACNNRNQIAWSIAKSANHRRRFFIRILPVPLETKESANNNSVKGNTNSVEWYHEGAFRLLSHNPNELGRFHSGEGGAMSHLIFPARITKLLQEISIWRANREWYQKRGIPWKRGWILYGPPGTGKTALARAFAEDEDMPLFVFSLSEMTNSELTKTWTEMQAHVPCIALFEDFDNTFHGRVNIAGRSHRHRALIKAARSDDAKEKQEEDEIGPDYDFGGRFGGVTFDCLINCLDGAQKVEGIFTIITTNDISQIDPAIGCPRQSQNGETEFISTRPGRIDKAIELGYMEHEDKIHMARRILYEFPVVLQNMLAWLKSNKELKETPAQFQERCAQVALLEFWEQHQVHVVKDDEQLVA